MLTSVRQQIAEINFKDNFICLQSVKQMMNFSEENEEEFYDFLENWGIDKF